MGNSLDKVLPGLYVGGVRASSKESILNDNGITHILSIHDKAAPIFKDRQYLCIQAHDNSSQDLSQFFPQCNDFIHQARLNGGHVLVHCFAGMSRSVTVTAAYIMTVTSLSWKDSLNTIRGARRCANPNFGFQRQLIAFYHDNIETEKGRLFTKFPKKLDLNDLEECYRLLAIHREFVLYGEEGRPKDVEDDPDLYPIAHDAYKVKETGDVKKDFSKINSDTTNDDVEEDKDESYIDMTKTSFKKPVTSASVNRSLGKGVKSANKHGLACGNITKAEKGKEDCGGSAKTAEKSKTLEKSENSDTYEKDESKEQSKMHWKDNSGEQNIYVEQHESSEQNIAGEQNEIKSKNQVKNNTVEQGNIQPSIGLEEESISGPMVMDEMHTKQEVLKKDGEPSDQKSSSLTSNQPAGNDPGDKPVEDDPISAFFKGELNRGIFQKPQCSDSSEEDLNDNTQKWKAGIGETGALEESAPQGQHEFTDEGLVDQMFQDISRGTQNVHN